MTVTQNDDGEPGASSAAPPDRKGDHVKTLSIWTTVLALGTSALLGCNGSPRTEVSREARATDAQTIATATAEAQKPAAPLEVKTTQPLSQASAAVAAPKKVEASRSNKVASHFSIKRLVVAEGVKDHEPVRAGTFFTGDKKIYAFVEVENPGKEEGEIVVSFEPPDGSAPRGDVTLNVGATPRYRTWAYTRGVRQAGTWVAVVKNRRGEELGRAPFDVAL